MKDVQFPSRLDIYKSGKSEYLQKMEDKENKRAEKEFYEEYGLKKGKNKLTYCCFIQYNMRRTAFGRVHIHPLRLRKQLLSIFLQEVFRIWQLFVPISPESVTDPRFMASDRECLLPTAARFWLAAAQKAAPNCPPKLPWPQISLRYRGERNNASFRPIHL